MILKIQEETPEASGGKRGECCRRKQRPWQDGVGRGDRGRREQPALSVSVIWLLCRIQRQAGGVGQCPQSQGWLGGGFRSGWSRSCSLFLPLLLGSRLCAQSGLDPWQQDGLQPTVVLPGHSRDSAPQAS